MKPVSRHVWATLLTLVVAAVVAGATFVWSGVYDVAADDPHTKPVGLLLEALRERSIKVRAAQLEVPPALGDSARVLQGAGNYDAMCVHCHLAPGRNETELSKGLYPEPPNLTKRKVAPAHAFWVIKHGLKATAMPAWGRSMKDEDVWNLAAFLQKLPELDKAAYAELVARSGGHSHGGAEDSDDDPPHDESAKHEHR